MPIRRCSWSSRAVRRIVGALAQLDEPSHHTKLYNEHLYKEEQFLSEWVLIGGIGPAARIFLDADVLTDRHRHRRHGDPSPSRPPHRPQSQSRSSSPRGGIGPAAIFFLDPR